MLLELLQHSLRHPSTGLRDVRLIAEYRRAQERLRGADASHDVEQAQLTLAAERVTVPLDRARRVIDEWMHRRPQRYLRRCRSAGLVPFLSFLRECGIPLAILSDYPISDKLRTLGSEDFFAFSVCAADRDVVAFKPAPAGFLRACARFELDPGRVLYIGDRYEVDGVGAVSAGLDAAIVNRARSPFPPLRGCRVFKSIAQLHEQLTEQVRCSSAG